jgi:hypothetical protein
MHVMSVAARGIPERTKFGQPSKQRKRRDLRAPAKFKKKEVATVATSQVERKGQQLKIETQGHLNHAWVAAQHLAGIQKVSRERSDLVQRSQSRSRHRIDCIN